MAATSSANLPVPCDVPGLRSLYNNPDGSDVVIRFGNRSVKLHRVILRASTKYWDNMFKEQFAESTASEIELHGDDPHSLEGCLKYIYGFPWQPKDSPTYITCAIKTYIVSDKYATEALSQALIQFLDAQFQQMNLNKLWAAIHFSRNNLVPQKLHDLIAKHQTLCITKLWSIGPFKKLFKQDIAFATDIFISNSEILGWTDGIIIPVYKKVIEHKDSAYALKVLQLRSTAKLAQDSQRFAPLHKHLPEQAVQELLLKNKMQCQDLTLTLFQ